MSELIAIGFFLIGIIFMIAGKPFIEVAACFIICGIFHGCYEIHELRLYLEDEDESE